MEDYPRNLQEFNARFGCDEDCRQYLGLLRWPEGLHCPRCGCGQSAPVRVTVALPRLQVSGFRNGGNHLSGHPYST
ncbi:MAG: transposase [Terracidiphilus sp.]